MYAFVLINLHLPVPLICCRTIVWDGRRNPDRPHSLITCKTRAEHARLRVPWNYAFRSESLRDYQPIIVRRASQLVEVLEKRALARETVNLVTYMSYFACVRVRLLDGCVILTMTL